jgi:hypothetical protein
MTTLNLNQTQSITTQPAVVKQLSSVTVSRIVDNGESVFAFVQELNGHIILWDGNTSPNYQAIGDWTQEQANSQILALVSAM